MMIVVLAGVAGSGKTAVGMALAARLGWAFEDSDALHSPADVAKMHSGVPLTDADRWPWLEAIAASIDTFRREGMGAVVACSALKRAYRDILIGERRDVRLVYLQGDQKLIAGRLATRDGHFMPPKLLGSQFAALEEPQDAITVDIGSTPDSIVEEIARRLQAS